MLSPKKTKFRKYQKGRTVGIKPNLTDLQFGKYGQKLLECGRISARTIEAVSLEKYISWVSNKLDEM